jgi:hypothetical protein
VCVCVCVCVPPHCGPLTRGAVLQVCVDAGAQEERPGTCIVYSKLSLGVSEVETIVQVGR